MEASDACRVCGAPIRWALHEPTGDKVPLDAAADPNGDVTVVGWLGNLDPMMPVILMGHHYDREWTAHRYRLHFATCPAGDERQRQRAPRSAADHEMIHAAKARRRVVLDSGESVVLVAWKPRGDPKALVDQGGHRRWVRCSSVVGVDD